MPAIRKRNNSYQVRVSVGYDMTGKQIIKTKTFQKPIDMTDKQFDKRIIQLANEFEQSVINGAYNSNGKMKLAEFYPQYMDFIKHSIAPTTQVSYKRIIESFILPQMGNMKLIDIKPIHVQRFIQAMLDPHTGANNEQVTFKPSTVRRYYVVLQSMLCRACKLGLIAVNPADSDKIDLPSLGNQEIEVMTAEQVQTVLGYLQNEPLMYNVLIYLAIITGCRRGELVGLKWDCIDLERGSVTIKRSNYKIKGEKIASKEPKSKGSVRTISIDTYCIDLLKQYKQEQDQQAIDLGDRWVYDNWVFTQWNGEPMHPNTPSHWFADFLNKHKLLHFKFHALRHTSATLQIANGTNIKTVASRLGHSQLSTTNIYLHNVHEADKASAEMLGNIINNTRGKAI